MCLILSLFSQHAIKASVLRCGLLKEICWLHHIFSFCSLEGFFFLFWVHCFSCWFHCYLSSLTVICLVYALSSSTSSLIVKKILFFLSFQSWSSQEIHSPLQSDLVAFCSWCFSTSLNLVVGVQNIVIKATLLALFGCKVIQG
ncbi:unnamed protein product [Prunus armeniaca]